MTDWRPSFRDGLTFAQIGIWLLAGAAQAAPAPTEIAQARSIFADAQAVSNKEGGHLWGMPLYGRMLLVDPEYTRCHRQHSGSGQAADRLRRPRHPHDAAKRHHLECADGVGRPALDHADAAHHPAGCVTLAASPWR